MTRAWCKGGSALVGLAALASVTGCGGGAPLLHPARALGAGEVRVAGGLSANAVVGNASKDLTAARNQAASSSNIPGAAGTNPTYAKGALVEAVLAPGIAPYISARAGIGHGAEGGITYTGRGGRVDVRITKDQRNGVTYSAGVGVSAAFYGTQQGETLPAVVLSQIHGYGADIPLLVGWSSASQVYQVWAGARAGFEHDTIDDLTSEPGSNIGAEPIRLTGTRYSAGGLLGLAVGFRHLHVAMEIDASYVDVDGAYNGTHVTFGGVSLTPAAAILWTF